MRYLAIAAIALASAACGEAPPSARSDTPPTPAVDPAPPAPPPQTTLDPAKATILSAEEGQKLGKQCSRISPGPIEGTWAPDAAVIGDLEAALPAEVTKQATDKNKPEVRAENYHRQYAGLVVGRRQIVYVNAIDSSAVANSPKQDSWKTEPAMICDGGTMTFGVEYDPAAKTFANFAFNGPY